MPQIPEATIEEVRNRTDIYEIISARVDLKRSSDGWVACCPFHNEKTPSFHVSARRQRYHCFGCGVDGDVYKFLMEHDGMTFMDAVKMLAEQAGVEIHYEADDGKAALSKRLYQINAEVAAFFHRCLLQTPQAQVARDYLASRDLGPEIVENFNLGYDPDAWGTLEKFAAVHHFTLDEMEAAGIGTLRNGKLADRFHGRLMFPIADNNGRVVAFSSRILEKDAKAAKYVNSPETAVFRKSNVLFALDKAQREIVKHKHREAIICEGQIDVIRCHSCGFPRAVASQGTAFTSEHAHLLRRYADTVVELFDSDNAGRKAAVRTAPLLLAEGFGVRIAQIPDGKDPDEFLRANPPEAMQKVLDDAEEIVPFQIRYLRDAEENPDAPDAKQRIVDGVLATIAACPKDHVFQQRAMVQDLARIMNFPEADLVSRLDVVKQELVRQQQRAEERELARQMAEAARAAAPAAATAPARPAPAKPSASSGAFPPADWDPGNEEPFEHEDAPAAPAAGAAKPATAPATDAQPLPIELELLELLYHSVPPESDNLNVVRMLEQFLPVSIIPTTLVRRAVEAYYKLLELPPNAPAENDPVLQLREADPAAEELLGRFDTTDNRTGDVKGCTPVDSVHEIVQQAWAAHLQSRLANQTDFRERMQTQKNIRILKGTWDNAEPLVRTFADLPQRILSAEEKAAREQAKISQTKAAPKYASIEEIQAAAHGLRVPPAPKPASKTVTDKTNDPFKPISFDAPAPRPAPAPTPAPAPEPVAPAPAPAPVETFNPDEDIPPDDF